MKKKKIFLAAVLTLLLTMTACTKTSTDQTSSVNESSSETVSEEQVSETTSSQTTEDTVKGDFAWVKTHAPADFTQEDFKLANSTSYMVEPGSGKAVHVNIKEYGATPDNPMVTQLSIVDFESDIYRWIDADGNYYWFRDTHGMGTDSYVVLYSNGTGVRYDFDVSGVCSQTVYPFADTVQEDYEALYLLQGSMILGSPMDDVSEKNFYSEFAEGCTYYVPVQTSERIYDVYMDDNMVVKAGLCVLAGTDQITNEKATYCTQSNVVDIVDVPDTSAFFEKFSSYEKADVQLEVNGTQSGITLYKDFETYIKTYTESSTVTAENEITDIEGNSTVEITDETIFVLEDANTFVVTAG